MALTHLNRDAVPDSSPTEDLDGSITESFAHLDLSGGPMSRLPNEMVQSILVRLEMQKLIHLQVVCKNWRAVIYSIGHSKKSLYVAGFGCNKLDHLNLKERTFGQIDLDTFTRVNLKRNFKSSEHFQSQFVKLFPSVEQLVVSCYSTDINFILDIMPLNQLTGLVFTNAMSLDQSLLTRINSCTSLKWLDIYVQGELLPTLAPTLARLEQFSCQRFDYKFFDDEGDGYIDHEDDGLSLIRHFGPNCSRVWIEDYHFVNSALWYTTNSQWLAGVTHLSLDVVNIDEVIPNISKYAVSLQVLHLEDFNITYRMSLGIENSQTIGKLIKLTHLTEIKLNSWSINRAQLEEIARNCKLIPLVSI